MGGVGLLERMPKNENWGSERTAYVEMLARPSYRQESGIEDCTTLSQPTHLPPLPPFPSVKSPRHPSLILCIPASQPAPFGDLSQPH